MKHPSSRAFYALWNQSRGTERAPYRADLAPERMRVTAAQYRGKDDKDQPFQLDARSAVQQSSATPIVRLTDLNARIALDDGPATVVAHKGRYDMDNGRIALDGPVTLDDSTGYHIATRDILVDMNSKHALSRGRVDGTMNTGGFSADHMTANLNTHVVDLVGHARLHIVQRGARRPR